MKAELLWMTRPVEVRGVNELRQSERSRECRIRAGSSKAGRLADLQVN
jgi:hypothetical protein